MADFSKVKPSTNFEDRRPTPGFRAFLDQVNHLLGTGKYSKEFQDAQVIAQSILDVTRREPLKNRAAQVHADLMAKDPSIPADVDLDEVVDYWIRNADEATRPRVNLRRQNKTPGGK